MKIKHLLSVLLVVLLMSLDCFGQNNSESDAIKLENKIRIEQRLSPRKDTISDVQITHPDNKRKNSRKEPLTSLIPFTVDYFTGDEVVQHYEIHIYKKDDRFYAENVSPYLYYKYQIDSGWTIELSQEKINLCLSFINKAISLPKYCLNNISSSSVNQYRFYYRNDTLNIDNCDWNGLDFISIQENLYKKRFAELETKGNKIRDEISKKLIGSWYFIPPKAKLKRDDEIILTKKYDFTSECFWDLGDNNSFKNSCNDILKLTYSKKYEWHSEGNETFFTIDVGFTDEHGTMSIGNYGATFILESIDGKTLKLKYLWE